jgi:chemotaxis protein MotB
MALARHGGRRAEPPIWSGFVDALTTLLLVLMFVLTIFMVVQSVLRETIDTQGTELDALSAQVAGLADALGLEQTRAEGLQAEVTRLGGALSAAEAEGAEQAALIATLTGQLAVREGDLAAARLRITDFEAQVASLLTERDAALGEGERLAADLSASEAAEAALRTETEALNLALAAARTEIDAATEAARLAAARREALEGLLAATRNDVAAGAVELSQTLAALAASDARASGLSEESRRLAAAMAALEVQKAAADTDLAGLRARMAEVETSLSEAEKARLAAVAAAEATRADLAAQIAALEAGKAGVEADATAIRARLAEVEAALSAEEKARLSEAAAAEALRARLADSEGALTEAEKVRLADLAAAEALRAKLADADAELTAMTLALEEQRKRAEETLTLLAAAETVGQTAQSEAQIKAGLLEASRKVLTEKDEMILSERRKVAVLNQQIAALRAELGSLQSLLDASAERDKSANVQLEVLGGRLNAALAQVASEERRRAALEEAERIRLEAEKQDLERFRSEFFGQLREVLAGREGVRIVGDRFVFSSEVLFNPGSADLAPEGQAQIAGVVATLNEIAAAIPPGIDWIIRVDGHTDDVPLSGAGEFADNWELSQGRALSVVRYMQDTLGFPPDRMAATGFGEWRPVALGDSDYARALNRRIELKLTER